MGGAIGFFKTICCFVGVLKCLEEGVVCIDEEKCIICDIYLKQEDGGVEQPPR